MSKIKKQCDIIVVGSGGGLFAAVRAADLGAKVILLEKTDRIGGATAKSRGAYTVVSRAQKEAGLGGRVRDLMEAIMGTAQQAADPDWAREFIFAGGRFVDWMEDKGWKVGWNGGAPQSVSLTCPDNPNYRLWKCMLDECDKLGVEILMETRATKLITDDSGAVVGALAEDEDDEYEISAKAVILATGQFSRDMEMMKEYFPNYFDNGNDIEWEFEGAWDLGRYADGDGIKMARELGSKPDRHMQVFVGGPAHHFRNSVRHGLWHPCHLIVNAEGRRYATEDFHPYDWRQLVNQPKGVCYYIFDSATVDYICDVLVYEPHPNGMTRSEQEIAMLRTMAKDLEHENTTGVSCKADTIEEIAGYIGCDPEVLKSEIERYNGWCDNGRDEEFFKNPKNLRPVRTGPFYACRANMFYQVTHGGISANVKLEVIRGDNSPIPGLYATGDQVSRWCSEYGWAGFTSCSWATVSGYMSGENAVEYVNSRK